jgi:hypothetical protein
MEVWQHSLVYGYQLHGVFPEDHNFCSDFFLVKV